MDEALPRRPERPGVERREFRGLDCPSLYLCRSRRGMKRDDGQETYKLPHRLIEKKRRDRINECIAQLKDLLPEHLKLTTLGHLEKAVVLELTLKHLKALTALTEQQHQKIIALQNGGEQCLKPPLQSDLQSFHSGFQTCTKEVLQYLSGFESWTTREQQCIQLINHLHAVCTRFLPSRPISTPKLGGAKGPPPLTSFPPGGERAGSGGVKQESQPNCVPVIQRLQNWNHSSPPQPPPSGGELGGGNDTDTDSGYGGECEGKAEGRRRRGSLIIKQEPSAGRQEAPPAAKRLKLGRSSSASPSVGLSPEPGAAGLGRPDPALLGSLMALGGLGIGVGGGAIGSLLGQPPASPFCLPFYLISPAAAVASCVQPFLEKIHLEKHFCPSTSIPLVYPSVSAQATAGAFPCLSPEAEKAGSGSLAATILPPEGAAASQPFPGQPAGLKAGREWPSQSNFHS